MTAKSKSMCSGCRNDFYNGNNPYSVKECWSFKDAKVERRMLIHVDVPPPYKFKGRPMLSCYHAPRYVSIRRESLTDKGYWK